jgi:hypothetical protein
LNAISAVETSSNSTSGSIDALRLAQGIGKRRRIAGAHAHVEAGGIQVAGGDGVVDPAFRLVVERSGNREVGHHADDLIPAFEHDSRRRRLTAPADVLDPAAERIGAAEDLVDQPAADEHPGRHAGGVGRRIGGGKAAPDAHRHVERGKEIGCDAIESHQGAALGALDDAGVDGIDGHGHAFSLEHHGELAAGTGQRKRHLTHA